MAPVLRTQVGIQMGLIGGAAVAGMFFLLDLLHLRPLATPLALSAHLLGPINPPVDMPVVSQALAVAIFAGNVLALTFLHFLAFGVLGLGTVWGCKTCRLPLNAITGALYGVILGTVAFYGCTAAFGQATLMDIPGPLTVVLTNLTAGAIMGWAGQRMSARWS